MIARLIAFALLAAVLFPAAGAEISLPELLQKMDAAVFADPEKPVTTLDMTLTGETMTFRKFSRGHGLRINLGDWAFIVANAEGVFADYQPVSPELLNQLEFLELLFPVEPYSRLLPETAWRLRPGPFERDGRAYHCLVREESGDAFGYEMLINPETWRCDFLTLNTEDRSDLLACRDYRWIDGIVCYPDRLEPVPPSTRMPMELITATLDDAIPAALFATPKLPGRAAYEKWAEEGFPIESEPPAPPTVAELDALRQASLPGKNSVAGALRAVDALSGKTFEIPYDPETGSLGDDVLDLAWGLKNLSDFPEARVLSGIFQINDSGCLRVERPGGIELYLDPETGAVRRFEVRGTIRAADIFYRRDDGVLRPCAIQFTDTTFCTLLRLEWDYSTSSR